jgi:hypothetical protein
MTSSYIQAKHIPEQALIDLIDRLFNMPRLSMVVKDGKADVMYSNGAHISDIGRCWDNVPLKVIQVKLTKLEKAGKIEELGSNCYVVVHKDDYDTVRMFDTVSGTFVDRRFRRYPEPGRRS